MRLAWVNDVAVPEARPAEVTMCGERGDTCVMQVAHRADTWRCHDEFGPELQEKRIEVRTGRWRGVHKRDSWAAHWLR